MSERLFESPFWWRVIFECIQPNKFMNPNQCLRIPHFQHQNQLYQLKTAFVSSLNCLVSSQKWWNLNLLTTMANIPFGRIRFSSKLITRPSSEVTRDTKLTVSGENVHNKNQFNMFLSGIQWMFGPHRKKRENVTATQSHATFFLINLDVVHQRCHIQIHVSLLLSFFSPIIPSSSFIQAPANIFPSENSIKLTWW